MEIEKEILTYQLKGYTLVIVHKRNATGWSTWFKPLDSDEVAYDLFYQTYAHGLDREKSIVRTIEKMKKNGH